MNIGCQRVLAKLRRKTRSGVNAFDFNKGFAIRSRIADLRAMGYNIKTELKHGKVADYFLLSEPKS